MFRFKLFIPEHLKEALGALATDIHRAPFVLANAQREAGDVQSEYLAANVHKYYCMMST